ncbi:MAG: hypothetical protein GEU98_25885 [Pseudonocardiaceae bacterium]|nr:hypothetical protein [Pseudonocardiaceae bacterium]
MGSETVDGEAVLCAESTEQWRQWLHDHAATEKAVWLVLFGKSSGTPSVDMAEAVEHALCFGWIDSKSIKRDEHSRYQRFTPRNPKSYWSGVNRERVATLTEQGLMTPAGQRLIDLAKTTGTWDALADAERSLVPDDLRAALDREPEARVNFENYPLSVRRGLLSWVHTAKRDDTRKRRIARVVELARLNLRPQ